MKAPKVSVEGSGTVRLDFSNGEMVELTWVEQINMFSLRCREGSISLKPSAANHMYFTTDILQEKTY